MSEYSDGFDDGKGEKFDELMEEIVSLREQLKDCSAAFDRQQEMLDRNAEQIATLREQLVKKEDNGTTHWAGCSESGARHYKCALLEIGRLRDTVTDLRNKLEKLQEKNGG